MTHSHRGLNCRLAAGVFAEPLRMNLGFDAWALENSAAARRAAGPDAPVSRTSIIKDCVKLSNG